MIVIGIDPGVSGAIAVLGEGVPALHDMPTMAKGRGKKRQVNAAALADLLIAARESGDGVLVMLEQVGAMPGQGVSSMFGFGESFGAVRGACAALRLPLQLVTPQQWKRRFGLIGADKDLARTRAVELYPDVSAQLARKKDVGRADALLIARYGMEASAWATTKTA